MIATIRVRGTVNVTREIKRTLELLRLFRPNHLMLLKEENTGLKMVEKSKDFVTYGKISDETLAILLEKRGRLEGNKKLGKEFLKEKGFADFSAFAEAIMSGQKTLKELGVKPVFRLHPPRKGYERGGIKKPYSLGGALGNRKEKINELIKSMV